MPSRMVQEVTGVRKGVGRQSVVVKRGEIWKIISQ